MIKNNSASPQKRGDFPVVLIVLAVIVLLLAFAGAFTFSFVKSKILNSQVTNIASLGNLAKLPGGSTVKTKEEGIAVCKKSGLDYCYSLVAVSFNDLSVCKLAADAASCESDAKELIGSAVNSSSNQVAESNKQTTTAASGTDEQYKELKECKTGTYYQTIDGKMSIVGKENVNLDGTKYEVCCWEASSNKFSDETLQAVKSCSMTDPSHEGIVIYNKINNRYVPVGATLKVNGKQCTYVFKEDGSLEDKICQ